MFYMHPIYHFSLSLFFSHFLSYSTSQCEPLSGKVQKILIWRWQELSDEEKKLMESVADCKRKPPRQREYFVKYHDMSYWNCDWVTELQVLYFIVLISFSFFVTFLRVCCCYWFAIFCWLYDFHIFQYNYLLLNNYLETCNISDNFYDLIIPKSCSIASVADGGL